MAELSHQQLWHISQSEATRLENEEGGFRRLLEQRLTVLCCYQFGSGNLVEGRVDNVKGVNLRRSFDKSCQRL